MSAFWIIGIGINVTVLAVVVVWAVRNWPARDRGRRRPR